MCLAQPMPLFAKMKEAHDLSMFKRFKSLSKASPKDYEYISYRAWARAKVTRM